MSQSSSDLPESLEEERVETLLQHSDLINNEIKEIEDIFDDVLYSDRNPMEWGDFMGTMRTRFYDRVNDDSLNELVTALLNSVAGWNPERHDRLKEENEDLAENMRILSSKFGLPVKRRSQRINQGRRYWSNVKSSVTLRSDNPVHRHEITIDHEEVVEIDSSLNGSMILARHLTQQVADYPDVIGEEVISSVDRSEVEKINELSEEILELMDDQDDIEIDPETEEETSPAETNE